MVSVMYYIKDNSAAVESDEKLVAPKKAGWALEYESPLESSFIFEAEGAGFFRVKGTSKKVNESIPSNECAPIAIF